MTTSDPLVELQRKLDDLIIDYALEAGLQGISPRLVTFAAIREALMYRKKRNQADEFVRKMREKHLPVESGGASPDDEGGD